MQRRLLLLVPLVVLLAAGGLYLLARGGGARGGAERARPEAGGAAAPARPAPALAADAAPRAGARAEEAPREVAPSAYQRELADAHRVAGRVVFPEGTPAEERVRVVARGGRGFEHGPEHAVDVGPDGRFELAFARGTRAGRIALEARWLFLDEDARVDPTQEAEVVLEPRLGGLVRGRVLVPAEAPDERAPFLERRVFLRGSARIGRDERTSIQRAAPLSADLAFELRALPVEASYTLTFDSLVHPPAEIEDFRVQAGQETVLDLALEPGAAVAGVLAGEDGVPIAGAQVRAGERASFGLGERRATTGADGAFRLVGLPPGRLVLRAAAPGFEPLEHELGPLAAGETREDLRLVARRGHAISGVVTFAGGAPAAGASVRAEPDPRGAWDEPLPAPVHADEAGRFTLRGLEERAYRVRAESVLEDVEVVTSRLTGKQRERKVRTRLHAVATGVEPGGDELALVLSRGLVVSGRVTDDRGAPVRAFGIEAGRRIRYAGGASTTLDRRRSFEDEDGAFALDGLEPGTWILYVRAEGHVQADPTEVELTAAGLERPLEIRIERAARVAGVVLSPAGAPAPGATVEIRRAPGVSIGTAGEVAVDREGAFDARDLPPGALSARATMPGVGPSPWMDLDLPPGAAREGLVLRLTAGARITGVVLGLDGRPSPHRTVTIRREDAPSQATVQSDGDGAFALEGVEPGLHVVRAEPTAAELAAAGVDGEGGAALAREARVEVGPSGAHVVLEAPAADFVRVHGVVRLRGEPVAGQLWFVGEEAPSAISTAAGSDGAYAVLLPGPGTYSVNAHLDSPGLDVGRTVVVQGPREERVDLDLEAGSIEGRVLGPDGPIAGVTVRATREHGSDLSWSSAQVATDREGRYAFDALPEGTWSVSAGGSRTWLPLGDSPDLRFVEATVGGLAVRPGSPVKGVELHLRPGGWIAGTVVGHAGHQAVTRVIVRDADGGPEHEVRVAPDGTFVVGGLPPGPARAGALSSTGTGAAEVRLEIVAGRETKVELELRPATRIVVRTVRAGEPVDAHVGCAGLDGASFDRWVDWTARWGEPGTRVFGPLPPGTYVVSADMQGSRRVETRIEVDGEETREVELELP